MEVLIIDKAQKELVSLGKEIRSKFLERFTQLENGFDLDRSKFKKLIGTDLYELRVKFNGNIYRGLCGYLDLDLLMVLFFQKKTQKIPQRVIKLGEKRFKNYKKFYEKRS